MNDDLATVVSLIPLGLTLTDERLGESFPSNANSLVADENTRE